MDDAPGWTTHFAVEKFPSGTLDALRVRGQAPEDAIGKTFQIFVVKAVTGAENVLCNNEVTIGNSRQFEFVRGFGLTQGRNVTYGPDYPYEIQALTPSSEHPGSYNLVGVIGRGTTNVNL